MEPTQGVGFVKRAGLALARQFTFGRLPLVEGVGVGCAVPRVTWRHERLPGRVGILGVQCSVCGLEF